MKAGQEWGVGEELRGAPKLWIMLTTCRCKNPTLNISYEHTGNLKEISMERLCLPPSKASVSHSCLGQLFLTSKASSRSLTTLRCRLDLFFHMVSLIWVRPAVWSCSLLHWCKAGDDSLQCELGWLCSLRRGYLELSTGCSSQAPLAYTCV